LVDENELLDRARSLDEAALGQVFDTYYPRIYRYMYHHVHHQETAEELGAEVFVRLVSEIANGRGPRRHLTGWLYRVAHNLVIDDARRYAHRDHEPLDESAASPDPDVEAAVGDAVLYESARQALAQLTPKQRTAIVLRYLEGLENNEIAHLLKVSVGTVKARLHRGLAAMRRYLARTKRRR
jgi:RNA polymerase sigma-70 factor (ECF subfamily)